MKHEQFILFNRLFKSLIKKDDDLMGEYRIGKNKYRVKYSGKRMYKKPNRQLTKEEGKILWDYWKSKYYKQKCPRYDLEEIRLDIGWRCDNHQCQWCDFFTWKNHFIYLHKTDFLNEMKEIKKELGIHYNDHKWITISPKKHSDIQGVLNGLDNTLKQYFNDLPRAAMVKWALELGSEGDHPHAHILCEPNGGLTKNFSRDFTRLWKKAREYPDVVKEGKPCFDINTIKRPEYIRARIEYLNNETKGLIHSNPFDDQIESKYGIKKYSFFKE